MDTYVVNCLAATFIWKEFRFRAHGIVTLNSNATEDEIGDWLWSVLSLDRGNSRVEEHADEREPSHRMKRDARIDLWDDTSYNQASLYRLERNWTTSCKQTSRAFLFLFHNRSCNLNSTSTETRPGQRVPKQEEREPQNQFVNKSTSPNRKHTFKRSNIVSLCSLAAIQNLFTVMKKPHHQRA